MKSVDARRFHSDLKAALVAGVPLHAGSRITLRKVEDLESQLQTKLSASELSLSSLTSFPDWYRAGLATFEKTNSMLPVLESLAMKPITNREVSRTLRATFVYLVVMIAVAVAGLYFFQNWVVPSYIEFYEDLNLLSAIAPSERFDVIPWIPTILSGVLSVLIAMILWVLIGGIGRTTGWLGGNNYKRCMSSMTALNVARALLDAGATKEEAIEWSCQLVTANSRTESDVRAAVLGQRDSTYLDQLADYLQFSATRQLSRLKVVTPLLLVTLVGGTIAIIYATTMFLPFVSLIKDLPTAGIGP